MTIQMGNLAKTSAQPREADLGDASPQTRVETQLVAAALAGDGGAFSRLVKPHLRMLFRIAARSCGGDAQLAEDAVQETLTLVYQRLSHYTPGTSLKAFMGAIAARRAHTLFRSERRRRQREVVASPPQSSATPEELASAEQTRLVLFAVLGEMPKKRREAALLRLEGGLSYAEIAAAMDSTEGSARVLVHLALKALKAALKASAQDVK